ncbi:hypothetical protein JHK86_001422 [Glycine max]|nr:hypothetical protein JHK86_001422 [Glycine max]
MLALWNLSEDCCQWHGVTCNKGHVVPLDLSEKSISGGLVQSSASITPVLKLSHNNMASTMPESFVNLSKLVILELKSCGLNGSFPIDI